MKITMAGENQTPEEIARNRIDTMLQNAGWIIQNKNIIDFSASTGVAVREYPTEVGPADYVLFINGKPVGIVEAKREEEGHRLTVHESQAEGYAASKLRYIDDQLLPFVYESTGEVSRFSETRDPKPRFRPVFSFHRPESMIEWLRDTDSLRQRLQDFPEIYSEGLRTCQFNAISNLEVSFKNNRPRALIQMATGAGKTFAAITSIYRLLKFGDAKRILFLVDTKNLGEQAEQEFMSYIPIDDNRKFTELYNVQRLTSRYIAPDNQVCISTIQRLYSILKGEDLGEEAELENPHEHWQPREPVPVVYNSTIPVEFFDFIVIDECHRSIYNIWKQVLDYFDAFLIGLTATPDKRTFAFFHENVVSEYSHEDAVADGVNVNHEAYLIETEITRNGAKIRANEIVEKREKLSRRKRWQRLDEEIEYSSKQLDREIVNPSQIRNIIRTFREKLPEIFPNRKEIPKTLIFAKTDSHADDIVQIVREEFDEGNAFCKKLTYKSVEDPKSILAQFRNEYNPRIAVTVDLVSTGTNVKPLECLMFMRDVKSRNYFEQMKGRGTRTMGYDDLRKVTPSVSSAKTHFVIVDAVGVTKHVLTDSRPLERNRSVPLKDLLNAVMMGAGRNEDVMTSLAGRLGRLEQQITPQEKERIKELAIGKSISRVIHELLDAFDPDEIENRVKEKYDVGRYIVPSEEQLAEAQKELITEAARTFNGELNEYIDNVRKIHEQIIDDTNLDHVIGVGWDQEVDGKARDVIADFSVFLEKNKSEIEALRIFYDQPFRRRELTFRMIKEVIEVLRMNEPGLSPPRVWHAYSQIETVSGEKPKSDLVALVSLIRRVIGIDEVLTPFDRKVDKNFKDWVFIKNAGPKQFTEVQMEWLRMIKDHIATSFHLDEGDLEYAPFDAKGGIGGLFKVFGGEVNLIIEELNEALVA